MSDSQDSPDSLDQILAEFHREMDGVTDPEAVIRSFAERYPDHSAEFRGAKSFQAFLEKTVDVPDDACAERLGDFRIVRRITHGGMGDIYEAIQEPLERRVVVKTIRRGFTSPHARERFLREQRVLAETHQTHIVPVFAAGEADGMQYFAMPYLEGTSLDFIVREAWRWQADRSETRTPELGKIAQRYVERTAADRNLGQADTESFSEPAAGTDGSGKPVPTPARRAGSANEPVFLSIDYFRSVAELLADIADSLDHVHRHGFVHRDLKPSNIMVDTTGQGWVIDFGLAGHLRDAEASLAAVAAVEKEDGTALTRHIIGTPGYWAPEQEAGRPMDARTDVWGLGVTLYELITLRPAYPRRSAEEEAISVQNNDPPRPRDLVRSVPLDLEAICRKALGRDPDHRYETAQQFGDDLRRWLRDEPTAVRPAKPPRRVALWAKRNKAWASLIVVALVAFITVAAVMIHSAEDRATAAEELQQIEARKSLIVQSQALLAGQRQAGWSEDVWDKVQEAAHIEVDPELRDLAVSSLLGLDAERLHQIDYPATNVAFDGDGKRLLVAGQAPTLLLDSSGKLLSTSRRGGPGPVGFSEDGSPWQVLVESPRRFVVWDVAKNVELQTLEIPFEQEELPEVKQLLPTMATTPLGNMLAASSILPDETGTMAVWDTASGELLRRFPIHATALAFSPDKKLLAGGTEEGTITIWSVDSGEEVASLSSSTLEIHALKFTRDRLCKPDANLLGWLLAAADAGGTVAIWDISKRIPRSYCRGSLHDVFDVEFSSDGATLATSGRLEAKLWDLGTGRPLLNIRVGNTVPGLSFSHDGQALAVAVSSAHGDPGRISVFRLVNGRGIRTLRGLGGAVLKVWFSADGDTLAVLSNNWQVGVWHVPTSRLLHLLEVPNGFFTDNADLTFSRDAKRLVFAAGTKATLWNVQTGICEKSWDLPPGLGDCVRFAGEHKLLLFRFETQDMQLPPTSQAHPGEHPRVCRLRNLLADDPLAVIAKTSTFNRHVYATTAALDGSVFVTEGVHADSNTTQRMVRAFDGRTGEQLWSLPSKRVSGGTVLVVDPTGRYVLVGTEGPMADLHDLQTGEFVGRRMGTRCIGPGGDYVAYGHNMELFYRNSEEPIARLAASKADTCYLAQFSTDGRQIAWGNGEGEVFVCEIQEVLGRLEEVGLVEPRR